MGLFDYVAQWSQNLAESSVKSAIESVKESWNSSPKEKDSLRKKQSHQKQQTEAKSKDNSGWGVTDIVDDFMVKYIK